MTTRGSKRQDSPSRKVRVVELQTSKGFFRRSIHKSAALPTEID